MTKTVQSDKTMRESRIRLAMIRVLLLSSVLAMSVSARANASAAADLPGWVAKAGARQRAEGRRVLMANSFGAIGDGVQKSTSAIQQAIDTCAKGGGGIVTLKPGRYVTGALFLKSNVNLRIDAGVTLLASESDEDYPSIPTRVAGIEMKWPAALINVNDQKSVMLSGGGTIDGRGEMWWDRYRNLRVDYESRGLRWAADYDCQRVRLIVIWKSTDVSVENLSLRRSGFWTVQVVYSDHVTVDGIKVKNNDGPSTDGVDIDSSRYVLVENCDIDSNDDDICLKAGRDADGLRVNRPTEFIVIRNNIMRRGNGMISFGSETSGGIRKIVAYHNHAIATGEGIRFKSARTRGGFVEDVLIRDLRMENVSMPFTFTLDWQPNYSYPALPSGTQDIPSYWRVLATPVMPPERGLCEFRNITIEDVRVVGAARVFSAVGLREKPISNLKWINVTASAYEAGVIEFARNWTMKNVTLHTADDKPLTITDCKNVAMPRIIRTRQARLSR
jgi:Glycosyl hydrolases family 28